ncbi:hypothetical protein chiPu_0030325, partial [Chiloscyllium punctatum]|nr:hypothetical protein [Chiloscyllium punctatum]
AERADIRHQGLVALGGHLRIGGDFARRRVLLADRACDIGGDVVDLAHRLADFAHGGDGVAGRGLDQADILADLGGCLRGLSGERLDLVRNDREAAAGIAGAGGFDGGVEREQIGLLGDRLDQAQHAVDALGGGGKALDLGDRPVGARTGVIDRAGRLLDLATDLRDRGGELFGRARHRGDVAQGLFGRACRRNRPAIGVRRDGRDGLRGLPHRRGVVVHRAQHLTDGAAECVDEALDVPAACVAGLGILQD